MNAATHKPHGFQDKELPRFRILLIEDDPEDVMILRDALETWDRPVCRVEIDVHRNFASATRSLEKGDFDLMVTDYFLSGAFQDEESCTARDFLLKVTASHRHIPVVVWTTAARLDIDPDVIKCVLNQQVYYLPKHKFNLGSLRYLISTVQLAPITTLVVTERPDIVEEVERLVSASEFYRFKIRIAHSLSEAREMIRIQPAELCLIDLPVDEHEFVAMKRETDAAGTSLLVTCVSEAASKQVSGRSLRLPHADQGGQDEEIPVLTEEDLHDPALPVELIRRRNQVVL